MLSIIIPTLNEEKGIIKTLKDVNKLKIKKEVLVVDGLSTDKTVENAKRYGARIVLEKRKGKGIAMDTGVRNARGEFICFMDGDGTYPAKYVPKMLKLLEGRDIVVASRLLHKEESDKSISNFMYYKVFPFILRSKLKSFRTTDPITGLRILRKSVWKRLNLKSKDFMIELEMEVQMAKKRMKVAEIPIPCVERIGRSKFDMSWGTMFKMNEYYKKNKKYLRGLDLVTYHNV